MSEKSESQGSIRLNREALKAWEKRIEEAKRNQEEREMDLESVRESGAEVVFDCPNCDWEVKAVIGGPGDEHWETVDCSNPDCDYRFGIRLEIEPE